jgi:hypothetical protein
MSCCLWEGVAKRGAKGDHPGGLQVLMEYRVAAWKLIGSLAEAPGGKRTTDIGA